MRILALGDIVTPSTVDYLASKLWVYRTQNKVDMVIANAENASFLSGVGKDAAEKLFTSGVDVITGGNHTMQNRSVYPYFEDTPTLLRPLNFPDEAPGCGVVITEIQGYRVLVANLMGNAMIEPVLDNPFLSLERTLRTYAGEYDFSVLDFHAEASGEKVALGQFFDGKFALIWGTHTHVPTADEQILPGGTGYITDIGCCAPTGGILGVKSEILFDRYRTKTPTPYRPASGPIRCEGILADVDASSNRCLSIKRVVL